MKWLRFRGGEEAARVGDGSEKDSGEEGGAVAVVEVVLGFEAFVMGRVDVEEAGVHQAIGGAEDPDLRGPRRRWRYRNDDAACEGDEPRP